MFNKHADINIQLRAQLCLGSQQDYKLFFWEDIVYVCVCACQYTSAQLLGSMMDTTCLHTPWESSYGSVAELQHESVSSHCWGRQGPHYLTQEKAGILRTHTHSTQRSLRIIQWAGE